MKNNIAYLILTIIFIFIATTVLHAGEKWILVHGGSWTPDYEMLAEIKSSISQYIERESKKLDDPITIIEKYTFQYQGREDGDHMYIFINAFCFYPDNWELDRDLVQILDGGDCYFTLKYDVTNRNFYGFIINGEA